MARSELVVTPFGPPAVAALADELARRKAGDVLAPVTVVVPSTHAGITLRRALGGDRGLVNVAFLAMPQLVATLAAPVLGAAGRVPLLPAVRTAAIRAALLDAGRSGSSRLGALGAGPTTVASLAATLDELRHAPPEAIERLAGAGRLAREVVALQQSVRERCAAFADPGDAAVAAVSAVRAGAPVVAEVGPVLVHCPRRLHPQEIELIAALHERGLVTVLVGRTGDPDADASADQLCTVLAPRLGTPLSLPLPIDQSATGTTIVRAPDPEEEVRMGVRRILDALAEGAAPSRVAVVARVQEPYLRLVHEQLAAAGLLHHGRSGVELGQTIAGRCLAGLLGLLGTGVPRTDLLRWLRSAPIQDRDGRGYPVDRMDAISQAAGVAVGGEEWVVRLGEQLRQIEQERDALLAAAAETARDPEADAEPGETPDSAPRVPGVGRLERNAGYARTLLELTDELRALGQSTDVATTWREHAALAGDALTRFLGTADTFGATNGALDDGQREAERSAYLTVVDLLAALSAVDEIGEPCDLASFVSVLQLELDRPARRVGRLGDGVFVGGLSDLVGADLDLVVVLGMAEGLYPPRGLDDPLVPDTLRTRVDPAIPRRRPARADEKRDHLAVLACAPARVLSFPRADTRAQRERQPARWLLAEAQALAGRGRDAPAAAGDLDDAGLQGVPWFVDVPSFAWWADDRERGPAVSWSEAAVAAITHARTPHAIAIPARAPALARGMEAVRARDRGELGPYTGLVGPHPRLAFDDERVGSATSFEQWATCPLRYFLHNVLHLRPEEDVTAVEEITAMDRGSYVHAVLEHYVGDVLREGESLPTAVGPEELDRLRRTAASVSAQYVAAGRTGRPLLWRLKSDQLLRRLEQILEGDIEHRLRAGVEPVAVELAFGLPDRWSGGSDRDGDAPEAPPSVPPVVISLRGGRAIAFRGFVDRVDRTPEGDRLVVLDYKTGRAGQNYEELRPRRGREGIDIVCRGRHLQLALYALAAQTAYGPLPVQAFFWFVEESPNYRFLGGDIDEGAVARLREVLQTVVDGIEAGSFPARPGEEGYFGYENCGFCEFDRLCPADRGDLWEKVRFDPRLDGYRELAEGPLVATGSASEGPDASGPRSP